MKCIHNNMNSNINIQGIYKNLTQCFVLYFFNAAKIKQNINNVKHNTCYLLFFEVLILLTISKLLCVKKGNYHIS